ncbi:MAG: hypothetical protein JWR01_1296 [Subtercola sp.]|nr:hypothetical protein [Subtercola sp.]
MATKPFHRAAPDPVFEAQILKKVGRRLMPILLLGLFISYMDRANLGVLAAPMSKDLGLTASAFGLSAGLFYIGYLAFEIPSNIAMVKFGARIWFARIMVSWGVVVVLMALIPNEITLQILRILLGVAEAGFYPGVLLYLTFWYPQRVVGKAFSLLQVGIPISLALSSAITSALLLLEGLGGIAGWRWAFVLQGLPAVILGIYIFFVLPKKPADAKWLDDREKAYLQSQVAVEEGASGHGAKDLAKILVRPIAWVFSILYFCLVIGFWSLTYFLPQIVGQKFQVGPVQAGLISALPWVFTAFCVLFVMWNVARTGDRRWHMLICLLLAAIGLLTAAYTGNAVIALIGLSFGAAGMQSVSPVFWTMPASVFVGASAAIAIAMINSLGNISGLIGPWVLGVLQDATQSAQTGLAIMAGFFVIAAVMSFIMSTYTDRLVARTRGEGRAADASDSEFPADASTVVPR